MTLRGVQTTTNNYIKLQNYRYPSQRTERKGIIFFVHGYGEYCARSAYFAKYFADAGYDFCGFDLRNFGYSTYSGNREHGVV